MDQEPLFLPGTWHQAVISFHNENDVENITRDFNVMSTASLFILNDRIEITYHFRKIPDNLRYHTRIVSSGFLETGNMYIITRTLSEGPLKILYSLINVRSFILGRIFVREGVTYMTFRYHYSDLQRISTILSQLITSQPGAIPVYSGKFISPEYPLQYGNRMPHNRIRLSVRNNEYDNLGKECQLTRELKYRSLMGKKDFVNYGDASCLHGCPETISEYEKLYRNLAEDRILDWLLINDVDGIHFPGRIVETLGNGMMKIETVYPDPMGNVILKFLRRCKNEFPQLELRIELLEKQRATFSTQGN